MKEIPKYKVGDVVTIRKEYHKGCSGDDYPRIFDIDIPFKFGGRKFIIIKQFKEDIAFCRVPDDGIRYILNGLPDYYFTSYMFDESGDWRDRVEWKPKNGDIVTFGFDAIGIFEEEDKSGVSHKDYVTLSNSHVVIGEGQWTLNKIRPATEDEKQELFGAMAKIGKLCSQEQVSMRK